MSPSLAYNHFTIFGDCNQKSRCEYIATCQIPKQKNPNSISLFFETSFWNL